MTGTQSDENALARAAESPTWYVMPHPPLAVPAVGKGAEHGIDATLAAYRACGEDIARRGLSTLIVISPHGPVFRDAAAAVFDTDAISGSMARFNAPEARLSFPV